MTALLALRAKVPFSPSRGGDFASPPPGDPVTFSSSATGEDPGETPPLVLVCCAGTIELEAVTEPPGSVDVSWSIAGRPGAVLPALVIDGAKARLDTGRSGLFTVSASVGAAVVRLDVVLVEVTLHSSAIRTNRAFEDLSGSEMLMVGSGNFDITSRTGCAMYARAAVDLTVAHGGDAADVAPWLAKVHVGIAQSLRSTAAAASYREGWTERERITATRSLSTVVNPTTTLVDIEPPILDCGSLRSRFGAGSVFLSQSRSRAVRGKRQIEACDSPGVRFDGTLPELPEATLLGNGGRISFDLFLLAYSDDAPFRYAALGRASWWIDHQGTNIGLPGGTPEWRDDKASVGGDVAFTALSPSQEATQAGAAVGWPVYRDLLLHATQSTP